MISTLILLRPGARWELGLTRGGQKQVVALIKKLRPHVANRSVLILNSTHQEAVETARILESHLQVVREPSMLLSEKMRAKLDKDGIFRLIAEKAGKHDVAVLVTHEAACDEFPNFFTQKTIGIELRNMKTNPGEAVVIDCRKGTAQLLKGE